MNSLFSFSFESAASNKGGPVFMATEFEIVVSQDELDFIQIGSGYSQVNCFFLYTMSTIYPFKPPADRLKYGQTHYPNRNRV